MQSVQLARVLLSSAIVLSACAVDTGATDSERGLGTAEPALLGQDTYLYFRCNSTSWNPDDVSRLRSTADPYLFSVDVDVKQVSYADPCIFTETNQENGWGTLQTPYGTVHGQVSVPGGDYLQTNGSNFTVKYPAVGRYKVVANWRQGTFRIDPKWEPCLNTPLTTYSQYPQVPGQMYAGCANGDLYLTFNGTAAQPSWLKVDTWSTGGGTFGLPEAPINAIAVSPADNQSAYVAVAGSKQGSKLWKTGTGGATWIQLTGVPFAEIWGVSVNPLDTAKVYVASPSGVAMSSDFGNTWTTNVTASPLNVPLASGSQLSTVSVVNNNRDLVWVGATNGDVFFTTNATAANPSWIKSDTASMPNRMVLRLTGDPKNLMPPAVYATFDGMSNDSVWVTMNGGQYWTNLHNSALPTTPMPLPGIYGMYGVSVNPIDDSVLYIDGTYGAGRSGDRGATWTWQ